MNRPPVEFTFLRRAIEDGGNDNESEHVFGCPTMGLRFMMRTIHSCIQGTRSLDAIEWYSHVPFEHRTLVWEACDKALRDCNFLMQTSEGIMQLVSEWNRQIWLIVDREGLAE